MENNPDLSTNSPWFSGRGSEAEASIEPGFERLNDALESSLPSFQIDGRNCRREDPWTNFI